MRLPHPVSAARSRALLDRLESRMTGPLKAAYNRALSTMLENIDFTRLEALLTRGDVSRAITELLDAGKVGPQSVLRAQFGEVLNAGAGYTLRNGGANALVGTGFTNIIPGSPRAAAAMDRLELKFFPSVFEETEKMLRRAWMDALNSGVNPRVVARGTRALVGLTDYDYSIAQSYEFDLRAGNFAKALGRGLRDARYDALLRRAAADERDLTEKEISTVAGRYQERLIKWRAETWSRTASLNAAKEAQLVAWQESRDAAGFTADDVVKTWVGRMDAVERDEHVIMEGETVPLDQPFSNGQMIPGESDYNCRCTFVVRVVPTSAQARADFGDTRNFDDNSEE